MVQEKMTLKDLQQRMEMQGRALVKLQEFLLEMQRDNAIVYKFISDLVNISSKPQEPTEVEETVTQPTVVTEILPTEVDSKGILDLDCVIEEEDEKVRDNYYGLLNGNGSLFAKYFSPTAYLGGKGFLKPGVSGIPMFREDACTTNLNVLIKWPMGFYRNSENNSYQFYLPMPTHGIILDGIGTDNVTVKYLKPFKHEAGSNLTHLQLVTFEDLKVGELKAIVFSVETILDSLVKKG